MKSRYEVRNEKQMIAKSASTSTRRRGLERNARQSGGEGPGSSRRDRSCRSPRKLANWTRTTKEISTPTAVTRAFAEHVVSERGRPEQRREQCQRRDRLLLGEAVVDEPVGGVVGAALGDGPALDRPAHGHKRRVQDRDREHEQRQHDARQRRAGGRPARCERERGEAEADHLAAGVAHEDARAAAGTQVEGEEADAGAAEGERDDERELARVLVEGGDSEDCAGDGRERRGQAVHVVEQVEGVRDPDEPDESQRRREHVVADDLDGQAGGEHDARGRKLRRELRDRLERVDVVDEAGNEQDRAAGDDAEQLAAGVCRIDQDGGGDAGHEAEEDADAAEDGRRARMPALTGRVGDEASADAGTQQTEERQGRDRGRGDRGDRVHGRTG